MKIFVWEKLSERLMHGSERHGMQTRLIFFLHLRSPSEFLSIFVYLIVMISVVRSMTFEKRRGSLSVKWATKRKFNSGSREWNYATLVAASNSRKMYFSGVWRRSQYQIISLTSGLQHDYKSVPAFVISVRQNEGVFNLLYCEVFVTMLKHCKTWTLGSLFDTCSWLEVSLLTITRS